MVWPPEPTGALLDFVADATGVPLTATGKPVQGQLGGRGARAGHDGSWLHPGKVTDLS
ncbi:hypothetical protein [Streptomyces sp. 021-3]|uniref:hypothetical protein n=1 Tax=Streptomyces sp. 021-3 TaxID=2789259 RepID=UPI00397FACEB